MFRFYKLSHRDSPVAIVSLARQAHEESRFKEIPFCPDKVHRIIKEALEAPDRHGVLLASRGSKLVGFAYCSVGPYHIGSDVLLTAIHSLYVTRPVRTSLSGGKAGLGLLKGVETWSKARGAREVLLHATAGISLGRTHKLAKRTGYIFIGGNYAKEI